MNYIPRGVCSREIHFELDADGKIHNACFIGGCNGNLKGICSLIEGMDAKEVIRRLEGIRCNQKPTSCPDQLARALKECVK